MDLGVCVAFSTGIRLTSLLSPVAVVTLVCATQKNSACVPMKSRFIEDPTVSSCCSRIHSQCACDRQTFYFFKSSESSISAVALILFLYLPLWTLKIQENPPDSFCEVNKGERMWHISTWPRLLFGRTCMASVLLFLDLDSFVTVNNYLKKKMAIRL